MSDKLRRLWFRLTIASGVCIMAYCEFGKRYLTKNGIALSIGAVAVILYTVNCVIFRWKVQKS